MTGKQAALQSIVALMREHGLALADVAQALSPVEKREQRNFADGARRVFAWLGGMLIFAGVSVYISMFWHDMTSAMRITATLGVGFTIYAMTLFAIAGERFSRAIVPGLLIGLVMQTTGWFVLIDELFNSGSDPRYAVLAVMTIMAMQQAAVYSKFRLGLLLKALCLFCLGFAITMFEFWDTMDNTLRIVSGLGGGMIIYAASVMALAKDSAAKRPLWPLALGIIMQAAGWFALADEALPTVDIRWPTLIIMTIMGAQQAAIFYKHRLTFLLFALLLFAYGALVTLLDLAGMSDKLICAATGFSMLFVAHAVNRTPHQRLAPLGYGLGATLFYVGLFQLLEGTPVEPVFLAVAVGNLVYVSVYVRSTTLLVASTCAILSYIGYYTSIHFANTLGWPIALVLLGAAFIAISGAAFTIKRKMKA